jgi:hypothetical protein
MSVSDIFILRFRNKMHGFITILYILTYLETSCLVYLVSTLKSILFKGNFKICLNPAVLKL